MKQLLDRMKFFATAYLIYAVVRLLNASYRFQIHGLEHRQAAERQLPGQGFALAVWHENLFVTILSQIGSRYSPLASPSRDGEFVTFVMKRLGFDPVRGSSSRGGAGARSEMLVRLAAGINAAITVDGPKGPRRVVKPGIIDTARKSGGAILPIAVVGTSHWTLKSWDRFRIPKPFVKVHVVYGRPMTVPKELPDGAFEAQTLALARQLDELDEAALKL